jgi:hypothetical protein
MIEQEEVQHIKSDVVRAACEDRFRAFCHLLQEDGWMDPVHDLLCDWIQQEIDEAFPRGTDLNDPALTKTLKLGVIMPRGSLKTTFCTRNLSAWLPIRFSTELRSFIVTNTHPNAKKKMGEVQSIFTVHEGFRAVFPELLPNSADKWNSEIAILPRKGAYSDGTFESGGVGTTKTGSHYNVIIEDDTLAPDSDEMGEDLTLPSPETMEKAIGYHRAAYPLLVPKGVRIRIVVTTRWGAGDLIDFLRKKADGWKFFDMPAQDADGKPIFSMFYTEDMLAQIKKDIGPYMFSCLYQNKPMDPRTKVFKPDLIKRATCSLPSPNEMSYLTLSCDPAISKAGNACDTGLSVCGHLKVDGFPRLYVYEVLAGKFSMGETIEEIFKLLIKYSPDRFRAVIVENVAYQQGLLETLTTEFRKRGFTNLGVPFSSRTNKLDRIRNSLEPLFYSDRINLAPDLDPETFNQLEDFPNGKFVDILDCLSFHPRYMQLADFPAVVEEAQEEVDEWEQAVAEIESRNSVYNTGLQRSRNGSNKFITFPGQQGSWGEGASAEAAVSF